MVTVGNVESIDTGECVDECLRRRRIDWPYRMADAIECGEINQRLAARAQPIGELANRRVRTMCQKHRTGLRPQLGDVPRTVVFLVSARTFVLLDCTGIVFVERITRGDTRLAVALVAEVIEVE